MDLKFHLAAHMTTLRVLSPVSIPLHTTHAHSKSHPTHYSHQTRTHSNRTPIHNTLSSATTQHPRRRRHHHHHSLLLLQSLNSMDDDEEKNTSSSLLEPPRRRSLTIPTSNGHHHITNAPPSQSPFDFELVSVNSPTYISLRDLISPPSPSIILSPPATTAVSILSATSNASSAASGYEIGIRNRLVKQAAWAYLQPMSTSPSSSRSRIIGCGTWPAVVVAGGRWFVEAATRVWRWLEDAVWFLLCR